MEVDWNGRFSGLRGESIPFREWDWSVGESQSIGFELRCVTNTESFHPGGGVPGSNQVSFFLSEREMKWPSQWNRVRRLSTTDYRYWRADQQTGFTAGKAPPTSHQSSNHQADQNNPWVVLPYPLRRSLR